MIQVLNLKLKKQKQKKETSTNKKEFKFRPSFKPELAAMLNRTKVCDRQVIFIIRATAKGLGVDINS